ALALEALRLGRRDLRLRVAITNSEPLLKHQRAAIADAFGCPVRETYGMAETVAAASECDAGTLHQWPEVGFIERFADGAPAAAQASGELVCTGLLNPDMPLVRYRVGDSGRVADPTAGCRCGRTLPALAAIHGRTNDLLITRDGRGARPDTGPSPGPRATEPPLPLISVVIPCRDEEPYIGACLESILGSDYPQERLEVLVADGMSRDQSRDIVARYAVQHPSI